MREPNLVRTLILTGSLLLHLSALAGTTGDAVLIECSTLSVGWVRDLSTAALARKCELLDAPVTGTKSHAAAGELNFLVGGTARADGDGSFDHARRANRRRRNAEVDQQFSLRCAGRVLAGDAIPNFRLKLMAKDLAYALAEGNQNGISLTTVTAALALFNRSVASGEGEKDFSVILEQCGRKRPHT